MPSAFPQATVQNVQTLVSGGLQAIRSGSPVPLVRSVRFRSRFTPELQFDLSSDPNQPPVVSGGDPVTRKLITAWAPALYADTAMGEVALEVAGPPEPNLFPVAATGVVIAGCFTLYGVYKFFFGK